MRRKITKPEAGPELPPLTPQQSNFVRFVLEGKRASDAYRLAYDASDMKPETVWARASEQVAHSKIAAWISAGRMAGFASIAGPTMQEHLAEIDRIKELAMKAGNYGAAMQGEQLRGKAMGHYTERVEITQEEPSVVWARLVQIMPELNG